LSPRTRVLFAGHDFKFAAPLIDHLAASSNHEVRIDAYPGHVIRDTDRSRMLLEGADLIFCEWCLGNAEWYSHNHHDDQKLIVRFHSHERFQPYLDRVDWDRVDALVFICYHHRDDFLARYPRMAANSRVIFNLVNCDNYHRPKSTDSSLNLGMLGTAPRLKSPHLALEILRRLRKRDGRYRLLIKGRHPWEYDWLWTLPEERLYYEEFYAMVRRRPFRGAIAFVEHDGDVAGWFERVGFILSTSEHEGSHQAVAEGMASGAVPVIRDWRGASRLYPREYVFSGVDEAVEQIVRHARDSVYSSQAERCAMFARRNFDSNIVLAQYDELFADLGLHRAGCALPSDRVRMPTPTHQATR
jgi:glycosyltransferase involved in cell wall biosynthesis